MTELTNEDVWREARTWVGTPYQHHGRTKQERCDCVGMVIGVGEFVGIEPYSRFDYSPHPKAAKLLKEVGGLLEEQEMASPLQLVVGEVLALCVGKAGEPQHLAITGRLDDGRLSMIHAFNKEKRVVEHGLSKWWMNRIIKVYRFPNVRYL